AMEYSVTLDGGTIEYSSAGRPPTLYSETEQALPLEGRDGYTAEIEYFGVRYGQLGIPGGMQLTDAAAAQWKAALASAGLTLVTVFAAYQGEDYADIPAVARTVGFVPPETRAARVERTLAVSDFAALLGVSSIACH